MRAIERCAQRSQRDPGRTHKCHRADPRSRHAQFVVLLLLAQEPVVRTRFAQCGDNELIRGGVTGLAQFIRAILVTWIDGPERVTQLEQKLPGLLRNH
jgi:hypothetical protein